VPADVPLDAAAGGVVVAAVGSGAGAVVPATVGSGAGAVLPLAVVPPPVPVVVPESDGLSGGSVSTVV
jgi:hypothetical protein